MGGTASFFSIPSQRKFVSKIDNVQCNLTIRYQLIPLIGCDEDINTSATIIPSSEILGPIT
jgi:hypothetical protein